MKWLKRARLALIPMAILISMTFLEHTSIRQPTWLQAALTATWHLVAVCLFLIVSINFVRWCLGDFDRKPSA